MSFPCLYLRATLIYTPAACVDFMWGCTLVPGAHHDNPCNMCYTGYIRRARHSLLSHADASAEQGSAAGVSLLLSSRKARGFAARVPRCQVSPPCSPPLCLQCSAACRLKKKILFHSHSLLTQILPITEVLLWALLTFSWRQPFTDLVSVVGTTGLRWCRRHTGQQRSFSCSGKFRYCSLQCP